MHVDNGPNRSVFASGAFAISSNPTQGPNVVIPDGYSIVIKARRSNSSITYLEVSSSTSTNAYSLAAGEFIGLYITNLSLVWFSNSTNTDVIEYIVEK